MGIASDLTALKTLSDGVVANKVSRFAYTEQAYTDNNANGVLVYDVNNDQNIPVGTANVMKVNQTVIEKGWRARASSITRMLMNHFLGRTSYNLNKINDWFNSFLGSMSSYLGAPNGIATLDTNGKVPDAQIVKSDVPANESSACFTAGGAYEFFDKTTSSTEWILKLFGGKRACRKWTKVTGLPLKTVVHANGIWVASSYQAGVYWSNDGMHWTQSTGGLSSSTTDAPVFGANDTWVIHDYTADALWYSTDNGKSWTQANTNGVTGFGWRLVYGNGYWITYCNNSSYKGLWKSEDGIDWEYITTLSPVEQSNMSSTCFDYANGVWLASAGSEGLLLSEDTVYWQTINRANVRAMTYVNGRWFISVDTYSETSTDGIHWTVMAGSSSFKTPINSNYQYAKTIAFGDGLWVGAFEDQLRWSTDAINWNEAEVMDDSGRVTNEVGYDFVTYGGGTWIAGGKYSFDGKKWNTISIQGKDLNHPIRTVRAPAVYANGVWIGKIYDMSLDGNGHVQLTADSTGISADGGATWIQVLPAVPWRDYLYEDGLWIITQANSGQSIYYSKAEDIFN